MMNTIKQLALCFALAGAAAFGAAGVRAQEVTKEAPTVDPKARIVDHDPSLFGPDPKYAEKPYDFQAQLDVYGKKHLNPTQRPLLQLGRDMYDNGPFSPAGTLLGKHNILIPQLLVYGDLRTAAGYNSAESNGGTWANRLNLDVDLKLTATERVHALFRPLEKDGQFTRFDFGGDDDNGFKDELGAAPVALFFEGDLGAIVGGLSGHDSPFDMPIAAGLMPLLFHNGTWIEDAFTGGAFTIPARNSAGLDWSNYDISLFFGLDRVSNPTVGDGRDNGRIFGINSAIEAYKGYIEAGYAFVQDGSSAGQSFHSVALSFTKRYHGRVSNSLRYIGAIGAGSNAGGGVRTANGHLFLIENSLITANPSSVVPYFNLFVGLDHPVSAARDPGAGGVLKNTGLNFETDALTRFAALDATARDAVGGALGVNLLGSKLSRQLVLELAATYPIKTSLTLPGEQYAAGIRIQQPLTNAIILRVDGMYGRRKDLSDIKGARLELRHKF